jgi:hypothetical protein
MILNEYAVLRNAAPHHIDADPDPACHLMLIRIRIQASEITAKTLI